MSPHTALGARLAPRPYERSGTKPTVTNPTVEGVYEFIVAYKCAHDGNAPTFREIQEGCGISSTSMVLYYLDKLEKRGLIRRPEPPIGSRYALKIEVVGGKWTNGDGHG